MNHNWGQEFIRVESGLHIYYNHTCPCVFAWNNPEASEEYLRVITQCPPTPIIWYGCLRVGNHCVIYLLLCVDDTALSQTGGSCGRWCVPGARGVYPSWHWFSPSHMIYEPIARPTVVCVVCVCVGCDECHLQTGTIHRLSGVKRRRFKFRTLSHFSRRVTSVFHCEPDGIRYECLRVCC